MALHLIKLCVGVDRLDQLQDWQSARMAERVARGVRPNPYHVTRMTPRRADEVLDGGSLYWVIKRVVQARQEIIALEEVIGEDGIKRCRLVLGTDLIPTEPQPRRPFQGWRYLKASDAPADLSAHGGGAELPGELRAHLREIGAW
jgi:hypothetical protein